MTNTLLENMKNTSNRKLTENGATAYYSSKNSLVDLFSQIGSMRYRDDIELLFDKAFNEDNLLATKIAFYARDIRGGLGERDTCRKIYHLLAIRKPEIMLKNLDNIVKYGRYDDLFVLLDTPIENEVLEYIHKQLIEDVDNMNSGKAISLLAKWMPSINTSKKDTRDLALKFIKHFNMTNKEYRKTLASLRAYLNVTEVRLSSKDYDYIKYPEVASLAMNRYRNCFLKNDNERFSKYLEDVKKGEEKINASTLYPYNIVEKYLYGGVNGVDEILEEQWKALPNYVEGENNFLIMADVSGSMSGRPMATSVGLAIYFAQRNKGAFANKFMTFSNRPELVELKGNNLFEIIRNAMNANWEMNTDLESAFELVLNTAVEYKVSQNEMPKSIVIISDMEIDECSNISEWGFYDGMKKRFEENGYQIPNIVFWNVNARNSTFHASYDVKGVQLASGQSTAVFESLIKGTDLTAYDYMLLVLNNKRYDSVVI